MTFDVQRIERDLGIILAYIDEKTFYHELAHELLRVGEWKLCTEIICESVGDNSVALSSEIRDGILACAKLLNVDNDYMKVVRAADVA